MALTEFSGGPILGAFAAGVVSSLTPCVYPLIPITLAVCGAARGTSKSQAAARAVLYVLGMALTYTVLGLIAARSGAVFGSGLSNPWLVVPIAVLVAFMGLVSLDVVHLASLHAVQTRASKIGGGSRGGVFLMGAASGLVAAPCVAPPLVAILGVAAASGSTLEGAALLFSYSLGMGMLFLLIALFPAALDRLPRAGNWLTAVKLVISAALFAVVLLLIQPLKPSIFSALWESGPWLGFVAFPLLAFAAGFAAIRRHSAPARLLAALLLAPPIFLAFAPKAAGGRSAVAWETDVDAALAAAAAAHQPTVIDFTASWCLACAELEEKTFSDPVVQSRLRTLRLVRVDFTDVSTPINQKLGERFGVSGLPSVLLLTGAGNELQEQRVTGFVTAEEFLRRLDVLTAR